MSESFVGDPPPRPTRFTAWRLRSDACAMVDRVIAVIGAVVIAVPLVVGVTTWPTDRVLVAPGRLELWFAIAVAPTWAWLVGSSFLVYGFRPSFNYRRPKHESRWRRRPRTRIIVASVALVLLCLGAEVGAFADGAKGSLRHVGHRYEVSTGSLPDDGWVTVSARDYRVWQARFLRLDATMSLFGLVMVLGSAHFLAMHDRVKRGG